LWEQFLGFTEELVVPGFVRSAKDIPVQFVHGEILDDVIRGQLKVSVPVQK
jgi:hypothetical protein